MKDCKVMFYILPEYMELICKGYWKSLLIHSPYSQQIVLFHLYCSSCVHSYHLLGTLHLNMVMPGQWVAELFTLDSSNINLFSVCVLMLEEKSPWNCSLNKFGNLYSGQLVTEYCLKNSSTQLNYSKVLCFYDVGPDGILPLIDISTDSGLYTSDHQHISRHDQQH